MNQKASNPDKPLVIVGGGFAGSCMLLHTLLRVAEDDKLTAPMRILMLERKPEQMHGGLAYSKAPEYRKNNLNIGAKRVTPFAAGTIPDGFPTFVEYINQLAEKNPEMSVCLTNPPRQLFGDYVHHLVDLAREKAGCKAVVQTAYKNVTDINETPAGAELTCSDGTFIKAAHVVLATGFQEALAPKFASAAAKSSHFLETPYNAKANRFFDNVCHTNKDTSVLIIGTGLTAMDIAVRLVNSGYKGGITMMSRRALMHKPYEPTPVDEYKASRLRGEPRPEGEMAFTKEPPKFLKAKTAEQLVRAVLAEFNDLTKQGYSSEEIIGYWERFVPEVAKKLPHADFAGLLAANDVLLTTSRVGVTPDTGEAIKHALESGQLKIKSGTIHDVREANGQMMCQFTPSDDVKATLTLKSKFNAHAADKQTAFHDYVFSAMGNTVSYDPAKTDLLDPLWSKLMRTGKSTPHWTKMGVSVTDDFSMVDRDGGASKHISVIGVPVAGHMIVTAYLYPERPGAGGRLGPTAMNVTGITGATLAMLNAKYDAFSALYKPAGNGKDGQSWNPIKFVADHLLPQKKTELERHCKQKARYGR